MTTSEGLLWLQNHCHGLNLLWSDRSGEWICRWVGGPLGKERLSGNVHARSFPAAVQEAQREAESKLTLKRAIRPLAPRPPAVRGEEMAPR